jgi:putative flippase GtrA
MSMNWLKKLLKEDTNNTFIQLFRYTFVGGIAFLVDFGTLFLLTDKLKLHYLFSAIIAFILGLITNYLLSITWVFKQRKLNKAHLEFAIFSLIGIVGLGMNELIIWFSTEIIGFYYLISKLISTIIVYFWNFFVRKFTLFK